jgi:hypothetical protein
MSLHEKAAPLSALVILLVADLLQPIDGFPVESFLNRYVAHGGRRRRTMPVLYPGAKPDDIARIDVSNLSTLHLRPSRTRSHDQSLTKGVRVPRGARTRLKRDACPNCAGRFRRLK